MAVKIKTLSNVLIDGAADAAAGRCMVAGRCCPAEVAVPLPGAAAAGAAAVFKAGALAAGGAGVSEGAALGAPVGPPGGRVGSLMVGAAVGFGGKLMRTVSFFGCTLPVSFFGGGIAPVGMAGMDGAAAGGAGGAGGLGKDGIGGGTGFGLGGGTSAIILIQDKQRAGTVKFLF